MGLRYTTLLACENKVLLLIDWFIDWLMKKKNIKIALFVNPTITGLINCLL